MDTKQHNTKSVKEKADQIPTNGIVEENGQAYIWCGDNKILLPGGYVRLKS